jgi:hypothetical protein
MQPPMDADEHRFDSVTYEVIGLAFKVANAPGHGFLEKVYENALAHEFRKGGLEFKQQAPISVFSRATGKPVCLLINFVSPKVQIRRIAGPCLNRRSSVKIGGSDSLIKEDEYAQSYC